MSQLQVDRINDASGGVLAPISSVMRNRLIDAGFTINQRGYVSGTALSAGAYAHDRFKAGASGCTYTFTQGSTGVPIVITITAGSLQQVIEGANMGDGGTYVLSWTGTAQARFNGGTYGNSPLAVTGITAGANTTIEFSTGTCSFPQLEKGTQATGFEYRQYGTELALCQRYYQRYSANSSFLYITNWGSGVGATSMRTTISPKVSFRVAPTSLDYANIAVDDNASAFTATAVTTYGVGSVDTVGIVITVASGLTQYRPYVGTSTGSNGFIGLSAEL